jgi:hypothetical protein
MANIPKFFWGLPEDWSVRRPCPACGAMSISRWALFTSTRRRGVLCRSCHARVAPGGGFMRAAFEHILAETVFLICLFVGFNSGAGILVSLIMALVIGFLISFHITTSSRLTKIGQKQKGE